MEIQLQSTVRKTFYSKFTKAALVSAVTLLFFTFYISIWIHTSAIHSLKNVFCKFLIFSFVLNFPAMMLIVSLPDMCRNSNFPSLLLWFFTLFCPLPQLFPTKILLFLLSCLMFQMKMVNQGLQWTPENLQVTNRTYSNKDLVHIMGIKQKNSTVKTNTFQAKSLLKSFYASYCLYFPRICSFLWLYGAI